MSTKPKDTNNSVDTWL